MAILTENILEAIQTTFRTDSTLSAYIKQAYIVPEPSADYFPRSADMPCVLIYQVSSEFEDVCIPNVFQVCYDTIGIDYFEYDATFDTGVIGSSTVKGIMQAIEDIHGVFHWNLLSLDGHTGLRTAQVISASSAGGNIATMNNTHKGTVTIKYMYLHRP
jgi:hypothetical protein